MTKRLGFSPNQIVADTDQVFRKACELANTPPTRRQASKYDKGRGKAFPFKPAAIRSIQDEGKEAS